MTKPKVLDLFCGAGGASMGFVKAGFDVVGAVDADATALDTYETNLCNKDLDSYPGSVSFDEPLQADLSREYEDAKVGGDLPSVTFGDILEFFDLESGEVDVICGCPPCQNFSSLRDTEPWPDGKPKDSLLRAFVEHVQEEVPDFVVFENVSNIMNAGDDFPGAYVDWLIRQMETTTREGDSEDVGGYGHDLRVVNAADYGVPQKRKRTIGLFAYGAPNEDVRLPEATHAKNPPRDSNLNEWKTVRDTIRRDDLKEDLELGQKQVGIDGYPDDPAHRARRHRKSTVEMAEAIRKHGGSWMDLRGTDEEHRIKKCHEDRESGASSAYGIMEWDEPAPTLTTKCTTPSSGRFTHPSQNRGITFREAALLMDFPRWFELPSRNEDAETVVGNAVPPTLITKVAEEIRTSRQRHTTVTQ
ncbi:DNA cytosine methyltransferase [Haloferax larsenii]|uniref:DNA (cytosine-5-)-methyltransferase n=1 Tax=Haloferax larsenii TaxID=302484 RepID=A0ABY5RIQ7_HALLR|nr:DNA cytosine methyltransferase [Haloferax larsenii]